MFLAVRLLNISCSYSVLSQDIHELIFTYLHVHIRLFYLFRLGFFVCVELERKKTVWAGLVLVGSALG